MLYSIIEDHEPLELALTSISTKQQVVTTDLNLKNIKENPSSVVGKELAVPQQPDTTITISMEPVSGPDAGKKIAELVIEKSVYEDGQGRRIKTELIGQQVGGVTQYVAGSLGYTVNDQTVELNAKADGAGGPLRITDATVTETTGK